MSQKIDTIDPAWRSEEYLYREKFIAYILSGAYVVSFVLPSVGFGSRDEGMLGFEALGSGLIIGFYVNSFPFRLVPLVAIGNVCMVIAMFFINHRSNKLLKWGLTVQILMLIIITTSTYINPPSEDPKIVFLFGYYVWMLSQIGMCLLLWVRDAKRLLLFLSFILISWVLLLAAFLLVKFCKNQAEQFYLGKEQEQMQQPLYSQKNERKKIPETFTGN